MANIIYYSIYTKLKQCTHAYVVDNIDTHFETLLKEMVQDIQQGNEITLTKMIGKDAVNLLKLLAWKINTHP